MVAEGVQEPAEATQALELWVEQAVDVPEETSKKPQSNLAQTSHSLAHLAETWPMTAGIILELMTTEALVDEQAVCLPVKTENEP